MTNFNFRLFSRNKINRKINILQFGGVLFLYLAVVQPCFSQHDRNADFLGVAIYRLAEYITWPDAEKIKQYRIHIIDDSAKIEVVLKRIATTRQLHKRPMRISRSDSTTVPKNTQVVFLAQHKSASLKDILKQTKNSATLIISYNINNQRDVMINFITNYQDPTNIRFEINKANIINKNMLVAPEIILLGGTEIDVAHLYREAQMQLSANEKKVERVEKKIQQINQEKQSMEQVLAKLTQTVTQQKQNYIQLVHESKSQERKIQRQAKELNKREKHLDKQRTEIEKRSATLSKQQAEIDTLATTISNQNSIINTQNKTLSKSSATIESQKNYLFILSVLITIAILSALIAYLLYRKYQRVNRQLVDSLNKIKQYADRVEIANEQLQSFSYTVSHDLRAPLRSITGFSQVLAEDYSDTLNEEAKSYLSRIVKNTGKMDNLITEILMLSKLTQSEVKCQDNVNLSNIVNKELEQLVQAEPRASLDLNIKENVVCRCDPALIQIAMANIIANAWKYTSNTRNPEFEFGAKVINNERVYYFKDNGVGFDMKLAGKLFEPFQRLHNSKQFEGSGIGLATVKRVINLHHGKIWAESEVGKGATLYFTLNTD